ncbi:hypothetical protein B0H66DRAFT_157714 [Apodospora peruviana]|uniref:FHA domain-containing protein n=1 Tax=Apodospora peruviana TaxID=516989 RepID=A0AAE0IJM8_9PEZI|nr:hypothetical protein B0H66DRAFT_157714 [Apodospora peruviana]
MVPEPGHVSTARRDLCRSRREVMVKDLGSLHGTFFNDETARMNKNDVRKLKNGDKLKFGTFIYRGVDSFPPTTVDVDIVFNETCKDDKTEHQNGQSTTTFQVPDDVDYSSEDCYSVGDITERPRAGLARKIAGSTPPDVIDLTQHTHNAKPEIIDLSSPPTSPMPVIDDPNEDNEVFGVQAEESSSRPGSRGIGSPDLGSLIQSPVAFMDEEYPTSDVSGDESSIRYNYSTSGEDDEMSMSDDVDSDAHSDSKSGSGEEDEGEEDEGGIYKSSHRSVSDDEESQLGIFCEEEQLRNLECNLEQLRRDAIGFALDYANELTDEEAAEEEADEDMDYEDDYSSENEALDNGFPDEDFGSAFWDEAAEASSCLSQTCATGANSIPLSEDHVTSVQLAQAAKSAVVAEASVPDANEASANIPKSTAPVTIEGLLNDDKTSTNTASAPSLKFPVPETFDFAVLPEPYAREPSPSDAALPKKSVQGLGETRKSSAEILGEISGKPEFFAAREENKILVGSSKTAIPRPLSSVHDLCNGAGPAGPFTFNTASKAPRVFSKQNPVERLNEMPTIPDVVLHSTTQPTLNPWRPDQYDSMVNAMYANFPNQAAEQTPVEAPEQSARRTHVGISDIVDDCQVTPIQVKEVKTAGEVLDSRPLAEARGKSKPKRKVEEISSSTVEEDQWAQSANTTQVVSNERIVEEPVTKQQSVQAVPSQLLEAPKTELLTVQAAPVGTIACFDMTPERPAKRLRHIAERVGYAALGGVTAGAMIFGTLVYTAPTFV